MNRLISVVFALCYLGMLLGRFPKLRLDRTGIALLGALALVGSGAVPEARAVASVDVPTVTLLFGLMIVSAQLRLGGFYTWAARGLAALPWPPFFLLGGLVFGAGTLSALFSNDIVCLAAAPVVVELCRGRELDPVPFLLALAAAANAGSTLTLIGNPQNMLIGQTLALSFTGFLAVTAPVTLLSLAAVWLYIGVQYRGRWREPVAAAVPGRVPAGPAFDRWETGKGLTVAAVLLVLFTGGWWPRDLCALGAAGLLLSSRRFRSRDMLGLVDWQLLVLFTGLFVVNDAFRATGAMTALLEHARAAGLSPDRPAWLFGMSAVFSNAVSNVPAVMLLLPWAGGPGAGAVLAISSTLAGNFLIVGSIANIIVVDQAARLGVPIDWRRHARTGVPLTLLTLGLAALILGVQAWMATRGL